MKAHKNIGLIYIALVISLLLFDIIFPPPDIKEFSQIVYSSEGKMLKAFLTKDDKWRLKTASDEITPELKKAIIYKEDKYFFWHLGINPLAVLRAAYSNITSGERISGASTITMQIARMLSPNERTYFTKVIEMLRAIQYEMRYSKEELLNIYLSILPYGGNIEGVKSAAYIYFNKPPHKLSLNQAVLLTLIPNNPNKYRIDRGTEKLVAEKNKWLKIYKRNQIFPAESLDEAFIEPVISNRFELPNKAQHFSHLVLKKGTRENFHSSLRYKIQSKTEKILKNYINSISHKGIENGAVMIIDNKTMQVITYCGSSDFFDDKSAGQVNGIEALRSPGSTLKPALFAMAFDEGLITPKKMLLDIPIDFGGYEPENYDLLFNGAVTAEYALINSLNIPAVSLLQTIKKTKFIGLLETGGFEWIGRNKNKLGLSLILGGCGVTLSELTHLFSAFANNGNLLKLNFSKKIPGELKNGKNLFSAESAYLISAILSNNERPDFPIEYLDDTSLPRIAWKTGTSYGKRDAWAIGYNKNFTVGVWTGNFSGIGSPFLNGTEIAVPLLFDIFNTIDKKPEWFPIPESLALREVCQQSGAMPSQNCLTAVEDFYIENISFNSKCDLNKEIYVSPDTLISYCPDCLGNNNYIKVVFQNQNPRLLHWYEKNNITYSKVPPHEKSCPAVLDDAGLEILSPTPDYEYYLAKGSSEKIALQASSDSRSIYHYWYINDVYLGRCKNNGKLFYKPTKGRKLNIACLDDAGRSSNVKVRIEYY